ncbi:MULTISPECIES: GDSL-type esterase/lipase family protein [Pseudanabaena]|uniref:Lipolytic protein G-D-S-L family n=2 Tax=Pseudanabaena TaxID=1152 RepID=L8N6K8_9CYAN|nr:MULTISPECIES: GDSL-type esterase/lipase family protein [Pseudanabaena]ELS34340.1 lipolytic protein G-D-S-L family [Pseudanabaena biceps PCC 7429]MDG3493483.1 GDSL-type esterase/lipase family protein [Pseudanabaena catenata USMAC16]
MTTLNLLRTPTLFSCSQTLRVTAFGDSLIYGYGDLLNGGWVEQLRRQWMATSPNHVLYNLGVRGDTVAQVNQRMEQEFLLRGELRNNRPDLMILSVGVNDSPRVGKRQGRNMTDSDRFTLEIINLLDKAQNLCPVIFVGMVPVDESKMPFLGCMYFNHEDQFRYKEATKLACRLRDIPYLDVFDLWQGRGQDWINNHLIEDGLHPNSEGYNALFQDILHWQSQIHLEQLISQPM